MGNEKEILSPVSFHLFILYIKISDRLLLCTVRQKDFKWKGV